MVKTYFKESEMTGKTTNKDSKKIADKLANKKNVSNRRYDYSLNYPFSRIDKLDEEDKNSVTERRKYINEKMKEHFKEEILDELRNICLNFYCSINANNPRKESNDGKIEVCNPFLIDEIGFSSLYGLEGANENNEKTVDYQYTKIGITFYRLSSIGLLEAMVIRIGVNGYHKLDVNVHYTEEELKNYDWVKEIEIVYYPVINPDDKDNSIKRTFKNDVGNDYNCVAKTNNYLRELSYKHNTLPGIIPTPSLMSLDNDLSDEKRISKIMFIYALLVNSERNYRRLKKFDLGQYFISGSNSGKTARRLDAAENKPTNYTEVSDAILKAWSIEQSKLKYDTPIEELVFVDDLPYKPVMLDTEL